MNDGSIRILVIEDDPGDLAELQESLAGLRSKNFELEWAGSMRAAHDAIERGAPDIVLLDLSLPDSGGLTTLTRFIGRFPDLPVMVLTGRDDEATAVDAVRRGAEDYLVKGRIDPGALARSVRHAIERTRIRVRLDRANEELRRANARLEDLAIRDPLTGLLNRRGLERVLVREIERGRRNGTQLQAVIIDLDDFKRINDSFGHAAGDFILRMVGVRMELAIRATDRVTRLGGDEFLALLPDTAPDEAAMVAEKVRAAIAGHPIAVGAEGAITVTASLGVISAKPETATIGGLLRQAESALHASKHGGKNRVHIETRAGPVSASEEILAALAGGARFQVRALPIVRLADGAVAALELEFRVPLAAGQGVCDPAALAGPGDARVRVDRECLRAAASLLPGLSGVPAVHLNVAALSLVDDEARGAMADLARAPGPGRLVVEVEERDLSLDPVSFGPAVASLRGRGVRLAFDHVAAERSSLAALAILSPDLVKLDLAHPPAADGDSGTDAWMRRLAGAVRALGADLIATGIEGDREAARARRVDIAWGQGTFLAAPRPVPGGLTATRPRLDRLPEA